MKVVVLAHWSLELQIVTLKGLQVQSLMCVSHIRQFMLMSFVKVLTFIFAMKVMPGSSIT